MEFDVRASPEPGVKESRVAVVVAEYLENQLAGMDFSTQSKDLLYVVILSVFSLSYGKFIALLPEILCRLRLPPRTSSESWRLQQTWAQ